jgi:DNA-binding helix-hairpin-helix protein with protein kinase domain
LRHDTLTTSATLLDSISRPIRLGKEIGRGGEGRVYEVDGDPSLVAKVYHKRPLPDDQCAKLQAMAACWSKDLEAIAAWPRSVLYDPSTKKPCGMLMIKMTGARPLHELYGTTNRRRHFPEAGWQHLVLAARNTAAAFQTLHSAGIVVGDVNQGNLLVDQQMCVRMIDCDSFQISSNGRTFSCPVGTPHFTPPELQSKKLRDVLRSENNDRFGMAVLLFHLLFVGRHPFAGRYRGPTDLPIEKAIAERRFAFSKHKQDTMVDPPPASLLLEDLPPAVADLFESAFRGNGSDNFERPGPVSWVEQLEALIKRRKTCAFDPMHVYYSELGECPWCRIEDTGGPTFFVTSGGSARISADRLAALDERIWDLEEVTYPHLAPALLTLPEMPPMKRLKSPPKKTWLDAAGALLVALWGVSLAGAFFSGAVVAAASALSLIPAGLLLFSKPGRQRRKTVDDYTAWLAAKRETLAKRAKMIELRRHQREMAFNRANDELHAEIETHRAEGDQLQDVLVQHRMSQKAEFLRDFLIREHARAIPGLTNSQVTIMESYGVESANDLDQLKLYAIPSIDGEMVMELLQWRARVERDFVFSPDHGVTISDLKQAKEVAVRRFKISQARKILAQVKQIQSLAEAEKVEIPRTLAPFDDEAAKWKSVAKQFRDFQSGRQRFERWINRSPATIAAWSLGIPALVFLVYLFAR